MLRRPSLAIAVVVCLALTSCGANDDSTALERSEAPSTTDAPPTTSSSASSAPTSTTAPTTTTAPPFQLAGAVHATGPQQLAQRVVAAERTARDPGASEDAVAASAFELQQLYRQLGRNAAWDGDVLANTPEDLKHSVASNAAARREFRSMHSKLSDSLPAWRIVEPPPADQLLAFYQEAEATFGVPWQILAAVNLVETGMGRIRGTSIAGAQGPMQFMPATWAAFGEGGDVNDPHDAIMGAARYLAHNGGGRGEIDTALWNYNHSYRYVRGVKHYASVMEQDPQTFHVFYNWEVVYLSTIGDVWLPAGFEHADRVPVVDYVGTNPDHHLGTATN